MTVDRQCSSGMMAIGIAARQILHEGLDVVVAGGLESISLVQNEHQNTYRMEDPKVLDPPSTPYMNMLETAETVGPALRHRARGDGPLRGCAARR